MIKRILFLTPYPQDTAGSQRFRFEQYITTLEAQGWRVDRQSFIDEQTWGLLYLPGHAGAKIWGVIRGFARRKWMLMRAHRYTYVFIHREASPLGPPIFEWILAKVLKKKIIYDFDDAIWKENTTGANSLAARIKWPQKVEAICRWSHCVSVGNQFLAEYACQYNAHVVVNPTTLDTMHRHLPSDAIQSPLVVGWTGTHSTLKYLHLIVPVIQALKVEMAFDFCVIADQQPDLAIDGLRFVPWNKETEIEDLNRIDIGVMPLEVDEWAQGKCGFKALQFMALEKPVLVTPVGVNAEIVEHGVSGLHCESVEDWKEGLKKLLLNESMRRKMGVNGRKTVIEQFSVASNTANFLSLFDEP
ncbi:group 1 glycosyl transferase [Reichenbachiella sp. 5M10]|uniref:glycosyltransferase family 4 protein n=1 Tax=Reichenbachiella sp. 5M10 TaxID=1889772 RepID=UPI000C14BE9A|nr:glycosyltransferase family 4 protein [Reichenbachiella sp. 5M10]PIB36534.1 group 1 glycosyl transferase [Reichenbachiella sp. 5M10]